jgi:hypothetical protein
VAPTRTLIALAILLPLLASPAARGADAFTTASVPAVDIALTGISADGPADAWAVGFGRGSTILRYNGTAWDRVPTPTVNGAPVMTDDVSALAPDDVWMLADEPTSTDPVGAFAHWDGSTWTLHRVARPRRTFLRAIAGVRGTDTAWAVGSEMPNEDRPVAEFFDGAAWHRMHPPGSGELASVAVHSPNDVWAVGEGGPFSRPELIDRWVHGRWRSVQGLHVPIEITSDVAVVPGSNHVWVVGSAHGQPFAEFFGGKGWTRTPMPKVAGDGYLTDVVAVSARDAWAIGALYDANDNRSGLLEHWDGASWTQLPFPEGADPRQVITMTGVPGTAELWAAGAVVTATTLRPVMLHHS